MLTIYQTLVFWFSGLHISGVPSVSCSSLTGVCLDQCWSIKHDAVSGDLRQTHAFFTNSHPDVTKICVFYPALFSPFQFWSVPSCLYHFPSISFKSWSFSSSSFPASSFLPVDALLPMIRTLNNYQTYKSQMLCTYLLIFRYESLLKAADPIPLHALKLLVSMTEHSTLICRYCNSSKKTKPNLWKLACCCSFSDIGNGVQYAVYLMLNSLFLCRAWISGCIF